MAKFLDFITRNYVSYSQWHCSGALCFFLNSINAIHSFPITFVSLESALWMFSLRFKAAAAANSSQAVFFFSLIVAPFKCQYNQTWSFLTFTYNLVLLLTVPHTTTNTHTPHTHNGHMVSFCRADTWLSYSINLSCSSWIPRTQR